MSSKYKNFSGSIIFMEISIDLKNEKVNEMFSTDNFHCINVQKLNFKMMSIILCVNVFND